MMKDDKMYTKDHIWLNINAEYQLEVGITSQGDDLMGGLTYVSVEEGALVVESTKSSLVLNPPVVGTLKPIEFKMPTGWDENLVVGVYDQPWKIDNDQVMDREAYLKMCLDEVK